MPTDDSRGVHVPEGGGRPATPGEGLPRADEAAAIYAALRRAGAGYPAFWKVIKKAAAKIERSV